MKSERQRSKTICLNNYWENTRVFRTGFSQSNFYGGISAVKQFQNKIYLI